MTLTSTDLNELAEAAVAAARAASTYIASARPERVEEKEGAPTAAAAVVTEVDRRAEQLLLDELAPSIARFDLAVLTEEREDDGGRLERPYFWCIDPLDGTLPFVEGKPGYAVSIALVARDGTPCVGVVARPATGALYRAVRSEGAWLDDVPLRVVERSGDRLAVYADRSFAVDPRHDELRAALEDAARDLGLAGAEVRVGAGGVVNACSVLAAAPAVYCKLPKDSPGGGSLWDFAATACLVREAGAVAGDFHGDPLDLNRSDSTFMNHRGVLYASSDGVARAVRAHVGA